MNFKKAIVITGSIGSGKSTVSNLLKLYGYKVIDADKISHKILDDLSSEVADIFGKEFIKNNKVDRKALGKLVFNDKNQLKKLENLLSDNIRSEIYNQALELEYSGIWYFVDIPLFFENQKEYEFDKVLLIYATKEILIDRICKRDNISKEDAIKRINLQMDIDKKREISDYIIENLGDLGTLNEELDKFLERLNNENF